MRTVAIYLLVAASPYVLFGTFGNHISPHYCRVAALDTTNWTVEEKKVFSIPRKSDGESYESCKRYKLPYNEMAHLVYRDALRRRDDIMKFHEIRLESLLETCQDGWVYDVENSDFPNSIVSQFNLVCENSSLEPLSNSIYFLGMMVGLTVWGGVADRIGRKRVAVLCNAALIFVGFGTALAPNFTIFAIFRFFTAVFTNGHCIAFTILVMEITGVKQRNIIGFLHFLVETFAVLYLIGAAYMFNTWRMIHVMLGVGPCFIFLMYFVSESPRWLINMERHHEAWETLKTAAKINGRDSFPSFEQIQIQNQNTTKLDVRKNPCYNLMKLFRTKEIRKRTSIMFYVWFTISAVYYGFIFYTVKLRGNLFVIVLSGSLITIPGNVFQVVSYHKIGRRCPLIFCLLLCALISVSMGLLILDRQNDQDYAIVLIVLGTIANGFVYAAFAMIYIYTTEVFPTVLRSFSFGCCSTVARLGAIIAPFVNQLKYKGLPYAPMLIYGSLALLASFLCMFLPETAHGELPETVEDVESSKTMKSSEKNV